VDCSGGIFESNTKEKPGKTQLQVHVCAVNDLLPATPTMPLSCQLMLKRETLLRHAVVT